MAFLILLGTIIVLAIILFGVSIALKDDNGDSSLLPILEEVDEDQDKEGETSDEFEFG